MIVPFDADGSLEQVIADAVAKARVRAARVATLLYAPPAESLASTIRATMRSAIEPFTGDTIAKMVVICGALCASSDPAHDERRENINVQPTVSEQSKGILSARTTANSRP
jgi:hypothetical protein